MIPANLNRRVERLEAAGGNGMVVIPRHCSETNEQAEARWCTENPGQDLARFGLKVFLLSFADPAPSAAPQAAQA